MGARKDVSQTYKIMKAEEVLQLAEDKLIKVLKGLTKVPEKIVIQTALELYKRRIPNKVETEGGGNQLTVIKIIKNHTPDHAGFIDVTPLEQAAEDVINDKARLLNEQLEKARSGPRVQNKTVPDNENGEHGGTEPLR